MNKDLFENFSTDDMVIIYDAIVKTIQFGYTGWFYNGDSGHPKYRMGAKGEKFNDYGTNPDKDDASSESTFNLLNQIYKELEKRDIDLDTPHYRLSKNWENFCEFVLEINNKK